MSQNQQSQFSDSFYDSDFLQSDIIQPFSDSQQTILSAPDSDFTFPPPRPRAPDTLARVGPKFRQNWILYSNMAKTDFVEWWLKTDFGSKREVRNTIHWDGRKSSKCWEQFEQVAHEKTGEPKVMCKRCHNILVHPHHRRAGSSPMQAHLKGSGCRSLIPRKQGVDQLLQDSVRLSADIILFLTLRTLIMLIISSHIYPPRECLPQIYGWKSCLISSLLHGFPSVLLSILNLRTLLNLHSLPHQDQISLPPQLFDAIYTQWLKNNNKSCSRGFHQEGSFQLHLTAGHLPFAKHLWQSLAILLIRNGTTVRSFLALSRFMEPILAVI